MHNFTIGIMQELTTHNPDRPMLTLEIAQWTCQLLLRGQRTCLWWHGPPELVIKGELS